MMRRLLPAVLALAALLLPLHARADASAKVTVNGRTVAVSATGRAFELVPLEVSLAPGASADFTFDFTLSVEDGGLPVIADERTVATVSQCLSTTPESCGPAFTGFEVARASVSFLDRDPRGADPFLVVSADGPRVVTLETHGDSFAERLTQSGTLHVRVTNVSVVFPRTAPFALSFSAAWAYASPVPEAATWLSLAAALPWLAWATRRARPGAPIAHAR